MMKNKFMLFFILAIFFANLTSCAHNRMSKSSSSVPLSTFMEPVTESRHILNKAPLTFPATVAVLFVPSKNNNDAIPYTALYQASEKFKQQLLNNPKYISSVTIVQAEDTKNRISLDDIRRSYAADIVVILSYQQDQRNLQSGAAALVDATILGAFVFPGVETKTITLVDAKVIHIPNQVLIFRKSAADERSKYSTSYGVDYSVKEESINGLLAAATDVGNSLAKTLVKFENYDISQAVPMTFLASNDKDGGQEANDYWKRVDNFKSTGGGAFDFIPLFFALAVSCLAWRRK
jgi:rhombotail lipoprotein